MSRLKEVYNNEIVSKLQEQFGYKSVMEVPKITKITYVVVGIRDCFQRADAGDFNIAKRERTSEG